MNSESTGQIILSRVGNRRVDRRREYKVRVDGRRVGKIGSGEERAFEVLAGCHKVELRIDWGASPPLTVDVSPGQAVKLQCGSSLADDRPSFMAGLRALKAMTLDRRRWITLRAI
jgi:hypothetical protein